MPRLSDADYLLLTRHLREVWQIRQQAFTLVSTLDQHYLHLLFQTSKDLTEPERLVHRAAITAKRPSLPACAGRALRHLANLPPLQRARSGSHVIYALAGRCSHGQRSA